MSCHSTPAKGKNNGENLTFALAGNANVGKSVLFNQLTGSSQIIGNWPGKTVEKAEGNLTFEGQKITVIDLPGIYSFSTFGMEELVSREYIATENPDVVINVVDAGVLERNLFFTMQLIEMDVPLVVCLNQVDEAKKKGITIDLKKLEQTLGVPVVPTVAIRGEGIYELTKKAVEMAKRKGSKKPNPVRYGSEIEEKIQTFAKLAFETLDCAGLVRIDFMINEKEKKIIILEVNTIPGSLSFYLWEPKGVKFKELLTKLIDLALEKHDEAKKLTTSFPTNILENFNPKGKASKI